MFQLSRIQLTDLLGEAQVGGELDHISDGQDRKDNSVLVKIGMENHKEEEEQREQRSRDRQQQEQNDSNSVLAGRTQPNAASYHSCQNRQDRHPRQNVE